MNLRQKLSLAFAAVLPVLALTGYFLLTPSRAVAQQCPGGQVRAQCGVGSTSCETGYYGRCVNSGMETNFIFCPGLLGLCQDGVVCCLR